MTRLEQRNAELLTRIEQLQQRDEQLIEQLQQRDEQIVSLEAKVANLSLRAAGYDMAINKASDESVRSFERATSRFLDSFQ